MRLRKRTTGRTHHTKRILRIRLMESFLVLFAMLIVGRALQLQVLEKEKLVKRAEQQYQKVIKMWGKRGSIYDWKGRALAISLREKSLGVYPQQFHHRENRIRLARLLAMDEKELERRIGDRSAFTWIVRGMDPNKARLEELAQISGVELIEEWRRFYPHGELAGHLLGFVGVDGIGLEGLERRFDTWLQGQPIFYRLEKDGKGGEREYRPSLESLSEKTRAYEGQNLYLTIDLSLQYLLERLLKKGVELHRARSGLGVAMESNTGRIRALAVSNSPHFIHSARSRVGDYGFNPNVFFQYSPSHWRNRVVTDIYEPGSTLKVFLVAAALEEGIIEPRTVFNCEWGEYQVGSNVIHDPKKYGELSVTDIIKYSSNIGAAKIAQKLGREKYYFYLRNFGFGELTGIDIPGEAPGRIRPPRIWYPIDLASIAFGQGISVTPIQLVTAFAALVNGGDLYRPYVVERIVNSEGKIVYQRHPQKVRKVISRKTSEQVSRMLEVAVEEGTGKRARVPGIRIIGKTGTSQKFDSSLGQYSSERMISSFIGVVPYASLEGLGDSAREGGVVVLVMLDEPQDTYWGGEVAAPIFGELVKSGSAILQIARGKS